MSVFKRLQQRLNSHATKMSADALDRGVLYPVYEFRTRKSDYPDKAGQYPVNLLAYFKIKDLRYYITCPSIYNGISQSDLEEMNQAIKDGKIPTICFYGKDGSRNHVVLHEHGEEVDQTLLREFEDKMTASGSSTETTPAKKRKSSD